jgi:hypothetical protein
MRTGHFSEGDFYPAREDQPARSVALLEIKAIFPWPSGSHCMVGNGVMMHTAILAHEIVNQMKSAGQVMVETQGKLPGTNAVLPVIINIDLIDSTRPSLRSSFFLSGAQAVIRFKCGGKIQTLETALDFTTGVLATAVGRYAPQL